MINAIIIEDESLIAKELANKIKNIARDVQITDILPSLKTAKKWFLQNAEPDLIFMDIQLSDGVSFDLFKHFNLKCPVIFTTAYDQYAIRAFKVNGIDYLLKPIVDEELKNAIEKYRNQLTKPITFPIDINQLLNDLNNRNVQVYKEKFIAYKRTDWIPVNTKDITCFYRDSIIYVHSFNGDRFTLDYTTLDDIEDLLDPKIFYRANRQCIININAIKTIKPFETQKLTVYLKSPEDLRIEISRDKSPAFKKWFDR